MSKMTNKIKVKFTLSSNNVIVFIDGTKFYSDTSHNNFKNITELLSDWRETKKNVSKLRSLFIVPEDVSRYIGTELQLDHLMNLIFRGIVLPQYFYKLVLYMIANDFDIGILIRLLNNIWISDADTHIVLQFIDRRHMAITPDGCFLKKTYNGKNMIVEKINPLDITRCNRERLEASSTQFIACCESYDDIDIYNKPSVIIDDNYDNLYKIYTGDIL